MKLTARQVDTSKPKDKPYKLSDGGGLYLLVNPNGSRYWRLKYRIAGKEKLLALGVYPDITLAEARQKRADAKKVLAAGGDPGQEKQEEKQAKEQAVANSFERLAMEWHSHKSTSWSEGYAEHLLMYLKKDIFPFSGQKAITDISQVEMLNTLRKMEQRGVEHALVNLGGNVAVMGGKPDGAPWRVGVRRPLPSSSMPLLDSFAVLALRDGSAVTSGIYERAFEQDGKLYHHILDPRTGFPAETDLLSATVVAQSSLDADGYTTALIMMGADRALAFAEQHPALEAVLVTTEGDVLATSGIGDRVLFELLG